jgi:hypothetical protein
LLERVEQSDTAQGIEADNLTIRLKAATAETLGAVVPGAAMAA